GVGTIHLSNVCPGTYTVTETVAPTGYSLDPAASGTTHTAACSVSAGGGGNCTFDLFDPLGQITINKNNDLGVGQCCASFQFQDPTAPNPAIDVRACTPDPAPPAATDKATNVTDNAAADTSTFRAADTNSADGVVVVTRVCIPATTGNAYKIVETSAPAG